MQQLYDKLDLNTKCVPKGRIGSVERSNEQ